MIRIQVVLALCLVGALSPKMIEAQPEHKEYVKTPAVTPVMSPTAEPRTEANKPFLTSERQKRVVGQVISLLGDTVAKVVAEHHNETTGKDSMPIKGIPGTHPFHNPVSVEVQQRGAGVAKIHYYGAGVICSGIHFKPWIILTTGDCLNGKAVNKLFATVTWLDPDSNTYKSVPVQAESVTMDPSYEYGKITHNLAILQIYGRFEWDVEEFVPPRIDFTTAQLLERNIPTLVQEWKTLDDESSILVTTSRKVTKDLLMCGDLELGIHWYCVPKSGTREKYTTVDIGTPFYYKMNKMRRCLGMYMGQYLNQPMKGHLFQSFYPSIDWIDEYINEHPVPPMPV